VLLLLTNFGKFSIFFNFQDLLNEFKPISLKWNTDDIFTMLLMDGTILHVTIKNILTGDCIFHVERFAGVNDLLSDGTPSNRELFSVIKILLRFNYDHGIISLKLNT